MIRDHILFIDTETSGVPDDWEKKDVAHWPYIVQIAWLIFDKQGNTLLSRNFYIKPADFRIEESAIRVHHITQDAAMEHGVDRKKAIGTLYEDLKRYNPLIVAHFLALDKSMLEVAFERCGLKNILRNYPLFCTMRASSGYMPWANRNYPRLEELYQTLFRKKLVNSHDALADAKATAQCFFELVKRQDVDENVITTQQKVWKSSRKKNKKGQGCLGGILLMMLAVYMLVLATG